MKKTNLTDRLNEALALAKQNDNKEQPLPTSTPQNNEITTPDNIESFVVYEVQSGDYLESICKKHNLDYLKNIEKILKLNGITDANKIYVGQKLYLPYIKK